MTRQEQLRLFHNFLDRWTAADRFRLAEVEALNVQVRCALVDAIKDGSFIKAHSWRCSALWFDVTPFTSGERFSVTYSTRSKVKRTGRREGTPGVVAGEIDGH